MTAPRPIIGPDDPFNAFTVIRGDGVQHSAARTASTISATQHPAARIASNLSTNSFYAFSAVGVEEDDARVAEQGEGECTVERQVSVTSLASGNYGFTEAGNPQPPGEATVSTHGPGGAIGVEPTYSLASPGPVAGGVHRGKQQSKLQPIGPSLDFVSDASDFARVDLDSVGYVNPDEDGIDLC